MTSGSENNQVDDDIFYDVDSEPASSGSESNAVGDSSLLNCSTSEQAYYAVTFIDRAKVNEGKHLSF